MLIPMAFDPFEPWFSLFLRHFFLLNSNSQQKKTSRTKVPNSKKNPGFPQQKDVNYNKKYF